MDDAASVVLLDAQCVVLNARWHVYEEEAVARVAEVPGLIWTPLFPEASSVYVVVHTGTLLGRVTLRRASSALAGAQWVALPVGAAHPVGTYRSLSAASLALAGRIEDVAPGPSPGRRPTRRR